MLHIMSKSHAIRRHRPNVGVTVVQLRRGRSSFKLTFVAKSGVVHYVLCEQFQVDTRR